MKDLILRGWNFNRVFRLVLGIIIIVQSIIMKEWLMAAMGGLFTLMPIFGVGCCGNTCCDTKYEKKTTIKSDKDITYEEIHP